MGAQGERCEDRQGAASSKYSHTTTHQAAGWQGLGSWGTWDRAKCPLQVVGGGDGDDTGALIPRDHNQQASLEHS